MIKVENIFKTYKVTKRKKGLFNVIASLFKREYIEIKALNDVSFSIDEGEIIGLLGPNGAGKSTAIKVMSGILVPDSGKCIINNYIPWQQRKKYVKDIGVVFGQRTQLWWDVPIIDSYELLKSIYDISDEDYEKNLKDLSDKLKLDEFLNTPLRQLSLGQRMRAELAASLIHSPKILFLDEPTIGLDAVSKIAVREFIKQLNKEKKVTVILTTHDMSDVEALTDRIILIGKGKILFDGSLKKMKESTNCHRTLTIDFKTHKKKVNIINAELTSFENERAVYKFNPKETSINEILTNLSKELEITDMTSSEANLEEVIATFYGENNLWKI